MEMLPAGTRCAEVREWVSAYIDAIVKASVRENSAASAAYSRGVALATVEVRRDERRSRSAPR